MIPRFHNTSITALYINCMSFNYLSIEYCINFSVTLPRTDVRVNINTILRHFQSFLAPYYSKIYRKLTSVEQLSLSQTF